MLPPADQNVKRRNKTDCSTLEQKRALHINKIPILTQWVYSLQLHQLESEANILSFQMLQSIGGLKI